MLAVAFARLCGSAVVAITATAVTLAVAIPAAYVLARERFAGRMPLLGALLAAQMLSPVILIVPIYAVVDRLGLIDSRAGLILVYAAMQVPFSTWVLKNFFDAVPASLFEAATLEKVNLEEANLTEANMKEATIKNCNVERAKLQNVILQGATIRDSQLSAADLTGADLRFSELKGSTLKGTKLNGAKLFGAEIEMP